MKLLLLYWSFMVVGYLLAMKMRKTDYRFSWIQSAMMISIYLVCFVMGLRMGVNPQVTSNLGIIGLEALLVTIFCVAGSMLGIFVTRKVMGIDRYGRLTGRKKAVCAADEAGMETGDAGRTGQTDEEENRLDFKSTIIILVLVAVGMALGAVVFAGKLPQTLGTLDEVSYIALVVLLCILLFFVGYDLGTAGNVFSNLRKAGLRVLAFPFAAILGTLILGSAACLVMGFSLRESSAICIGLGWYSYAPVVIAGAGSQYMVASAVSFMHNVIREISGIILIPVLASKFGYIESTGVPGSAAMDVCMPIVERATRPEIAVYSFVTGLVMCIVTSLGVPLIMGV